MSERLPANKNKHQKKGIKQIKKQQKKMNATIKTLVDTAIKGIQEKKGKGIKVVDLSHMDESICQAFIVCEGNSPTQVDAIADSVEDTMRIDLKEKPAHVVGKENSYWIAMDYVDVIVHVFLPEARDFYNLENLWMDAPIEEIPDLD